MSINIKWDSDCRFNVSTESGFTFNVDATSEKAPCPTEILLSALGSCSATPRPFAGDATRNCGFNMNTKTDTVQYTFS